MKFRIVATALVAWPLAATAQPADQPKATPNPTTNHYVEVPGFFKLPPGRSMGSSSAVMGDSKGNIWVVDRCAANSCVGSKLDPIMEFDARGNFVKSFDAIAALQMPLHVQVEPDVNPFVLEALDPPVELFQHGWAQRAGVCRAAIAEQRRRGQAKSCDDATQRYARRTNRNAE